jgi:small subunit ribosomal protein S6
MCATPQHCLLGLKKDKFELRWPADWGRRQLVYLIQKLAKAHYLCINIEASQAVMDEIEHAFKFNDAVLRHMTVAKKKAETGPSIMMRNVEREEARKSQQAEYAAS